MNVRFRTILGSMRMVLMLASILIVSILIFKGYSSSLSPNRESQVETDPNDPRNKAREVNQVIQDAANVQRREIEKQLQQ